ncbi:MAG TPA: ComEC/Rec2 family competence protein, partial [Chlamydiales bacterium]|nr:ComEC/Rec2 family competence protein [Chlamydiales bacterium]
MKRCPTSTNSHTQFWIEQPALLVALSLLIGTSSFLFWPFPYNYLWPLLWATYLFFLRSWTSIVLLLAAILYSFCLYSGTPSGSQAYFSIASMHPHTTPFQKGLLYKGMLSINGYKFPCSISTSNHNRPPAHCDYLVKGKLMERGPYEYAFKATDWKPVKNTWSPAEFRYQLKERFRHFLEQKLQKPRTATFLGSLITGDVEDRSLRFEFSRLGLQHILAISGFHFTILIAFCSFFLGLFLPNRPKLIALLFALTLYFLFVGSVPAVQRSWLTALFYLLGKLIGRHSSGLNLLGVALAVEVILDPLISANLGFQLSFLSCTGILLFAPLFERPLRHLLPKHHAAPPKHIHLLSAYLRSALSIACAVNLAILPLLLYHFHQFPLLSLLYNLFFPFLVSLALFLLLISLLVHLLFPPIAALLFP